MIDIAYITDNKDEITSRFERRGMQPINLDRLIELDQKRLTLVTQQNELQATHNKLTKGGKPTPESIVEGKKLRTQVDKLADELAKVNTELKKLQDQIPNAIADGTPDGDESHNLEVLTSATAKDLGFVARDHLALNEIHQFVDFEAAAGISGAKFYYLRDKGTRLWLALVQYASRLASEHGFELMMVPHMVKSEIATATGFLPRGEERQIYKIEGDDLNLIATAEIPLTGYFQDQLIDVSKPKNLAGLSSCYRVEAGAYGKFTKGLYRVHQFEKLELYIFCAASDSDHELKKILDFEKLLYDRLKIPYRVVRIAAGDLGAPHYEKYDIEYWAPADQIYRELTSCSNCTDYQSARLGIKYKDSEGKKQLVHTLNGTAITSSRSLIAIIENHQAEDGSVKIPEVLQTFYGSDVL